MLGGAGTTQTVSSAMAFVALRRVRTRQRRIGAIDVAAIAVGLVIVGALAVPTIAAASGTAAVTSTAVPMVASAVVVLVLVGAVSSGARGGPLALESALVFLVLLAPLDRRLVLRAPALRQVVVGAVAGVVLGGVAALSVAPRLAELRLVSWAVAGGLVGACAVGVSLLVAGLSLRPLATRSAQGLLVVWWALDVALGWRTSPAWALGGSLPFDGLRVATVAWPALLVLLTVVVGVVRVGHLSVEKAWRRSGYADQIRLAVGLNDLRTALLLLRRRTTESPRARPWLTLPSSSGRRPVSQRGVRSLLRWPAARVARFLALAVVTGVVLTAAVFTPAAFVLGVVLVYVAGLDALDALAEELDHPHLLATFPIARGLLVLRHLPVPAALLVGFGLVTATTVTVLSPAAGGLAYGLVPQTVLATVAGGALTASRVAGPLTTLRDMGLPPEVVGPRIVLRVAAPLVPIAMTIVPAVLAFSSGAGVLGSLATSLGGVLVSVGMIAWSALVRR